MKKIILFAAILISFIIGGCADSDNNKNNVIVKDSIGRDINISLPLTRVVVANGYNAELINAIGALDAIVGVDYGIYQDQEEYKNKFVYSQVIGKSQRELNYERIIELAPQALILTGNGSWEEAEKKLSKFGIKVIVVDAYYTNQFFDNCKLMGKLFGKETRANEISEYFMKQLEYVQSNLKNAPKKTVYFEYRREGNTTVPGDYFYNMVKYSGADNIFEDAINVSVSSESIIERNPLYIVKVGQDNVPAKYIPPTEEDMKAVKEEIISRAGWDCIEAVKKDNILLLSHFSHGGASKIIGSLYIAKFIYPEYLPDLDPEAAFNNWLEYQNLRYIEGHTYPKFPLKDR